MTVNMLRETLGLVGTDVGVRGRVYIKGMRMCITCKKQASKGWLQKKKKGV